MRDETPAKWEAPVDSREPGSAQLSSDPASTEAKRRLVPTCRNSSWDRIATWHGEKAPGEQPQLELLALPALLGLWSPRPGHPTAPQPPLTVAVGEVEVSLGTGITVLPSIIGLAVTAAGEVLAGAIGEVRLTVTACREGQASSGCH